VERGGLRRQHRAHDLYRFLEPAHPLSRRFEFDAVGVMLVDLPTGAEPEYHPATGQLVERGSALGEQRRVVDRCGRDKGADPDPLGDRRQGRQQCPALVGVAAGGRRVAGVRHVMVGQPDAVPAGAIGNAGLLKKLDGSAAVAGPEREFHASTLAAVNRRAAGRDTPAARIAGYAAIDRLSSVSSGVVYGGDHRTASSWPGVRAAINARLEEVSFRKGMMTGAITLLVLTAAAAALVLTVTPSHGSPVNGAAGTPAAASSPAAAAVVPVTAPTPRTPAWSVRVVSAPASSAPAAAAQPAPQYTAQASQPSPYPSSSQQPASTGGTFGAPAHGRGDRGGYRPGRWNPAWAPRFAGNHGNFTAGLWRVGFGNRPLSSEVFFLIVFPDRVS